MLKGVRSDGLEAGREGNAGQRLTTGKGVLSDGSDTGREGDVCQRLAHVEGAPPDRGHTGPDGHGLQLLPDPRVGPIIRANEVRYGTCAGEAEGAGVVVILPVHSGREVVPDGRLIHDEEVFPYIPSVRTVSCRHACGHV